MLDAGYMALDDLKARLLPGDQPTRTDWDEDLQSLGRGVAEQFNQHCNRLIQRAEGATKVTPANCDSVCVNRFPIEEVTSVVLEDESSSDDITDTILSIRENSGMIIFGSTLGTYTKLLRVTYTGGYWLDDGGALPDGATALPYDLLEAFVFQCQEYAEARGLFSSKALRSSDKKEADRNALSLHESVVSTLNKYIRYS